MTEVDLFGNPIVEPPAKSASEKIATELGLLIERIEGMPIKEMIQAIDESKRRIEDIHMRTKGSCRFETYYKIEVWNKRNACWMPVQKTYPTQEKAVEAAPSGKYRIMECSETEIKPVKIVEDKTNDKK